MVGYIEPCDWLAIFSLGLLIWLIRRLQHEKEEWSRQLDTREKEVSSLKDNIQGLLHRITNLENKLNLTENEVRVKLELKKKINTHHQRE